MGMSYQIAFGVCSHFISIFQNHGIGSHHLRWLTEGFELTWRRAVCEAELGDGCSETAAHRTLSSI